MSYAGQPMAQGFFTPEDLATEQGLRRRQAYAQALLQSDTPQGAYGGLASVGNKLLGAFLSKQADTKESDLAKSAQESYAKNIAAFLGGDNPAPTPPTSISNSVGSGPQMPASSIPGGDASGTEGPSSAPIPATAPTIPPQMPQNGPDMGTEGPVSPPAPIQSPAGQGSMTQPIPMAQNQAPVPAPTAAPQMTQMQRLLATNDPRIIQQFGPKLLEHQMTVDDNRITPLSAEENAAFIKNNNLRPGLYGKDISGNYKSVVQSDMKSQGAIDQAIAEEIDKANRVPMNAEQKAAHQDRVAALLEQRSYHNSLTAARTAAGFTEDEGALMGALAERGVSLPTGFRSKEQQKTLYDGLLRRNPGKTPDQIADLIKVGKLQIAGETREIVTAGNVSGKVKVAENELRQFVPLVRDALAKVPRGNFIPLNQLMQMADTSISDPNLKVLKGRINATLNAYDMLAARGGTDVDKRREAHALLTSADGPEAALAQLDNFMLEAEAAKRAAHDAMTVEDRNAPPPKDTNGANNSGGGKHPPPPPGFKVH